ncbi:MAG: DUF6263 family protein [Bacteroidota bacterium]
MKHFLSSMTLLGVLCLGMISTAFAPLDQAIKLELKLKKGQKFKQWVLNDQLITQTVMGREQIIKQKQGVGYAYEVLKVSPEKYDLKVTFYRMLLKQDIGGMDQMSSDYDSERDESTSDLKPLEAVSAAQLNKTFEISLDYKSNILEVRGSDQLIAAMMQDIEKLSPELANDEMKSGLEQTLGAESLKSSMRQLLFPLPQGPIAVGDKWQEENTIKTLMVMNTYNEYEASELNNKTATIKLEGELETEEGSSMNMGGMELAVGLGGATEGEYIIDVKSGLIKTATYKMEAIGEMSMQGMTIPMAINNLTTITLEK